MLNHELFDFVRHNLCVFYAFYLWKPSIEISMRNVAIGNMEMGDYYTKIMLAGRNGAAKWRETYFLASAVTQNLFA